MSEYKNNILIVLFISFVFSFEVSNAINKNGMVVCSKYDAAQIGVDILKRGGNAVDAAVGVAFALAVTHPSAGNIGGWTIDSGILKSTNRISPNCFGDPILKFFPANL